jgi:hypothetical protein
MPMSSDQRLREELARGADAAGDEHAASYASVRRRGRQARVRDRIAWVGMATMLVAGIAIVAPRLAAEHVETSPVAPAPADGTPTEGGSGGSVLEGFYTLYLDSSKPAIARYEIRGLWTANVYPGGRLTLQGPARPCCSVDSPFVIHGHRIVVDRPVAQYDHCSGPGVYRWSVVHGGVRFSLVKDDCLVRSLLFSTRWVYEGAPSPTASPTP